jgi:hypothetical protein
MRVHELEERVGSITMNAMAYRGVWTSDTLYRAGECVTHQGTIWHCKEVTHERPPSDSWQLMVKNKHG